MLRRPDFELEPGRFKRSRRRVLFVIAVIGLGLFASVGMSPLGVLVGTVAGLLIILFGVATGWFVTHVLKIPRDGRGVHERTTTMPDEPID